MSQVPCVILDSDFHTFDLCEDGRGICLYLWDDNENKNEVVLVQGTEFENFLTKDGRLFKREPGSDTMFRPIQ